MTASSRVLVVVLVVALVLVFVGQQRLARRLLAAGRRLSAGRRAQRRRAWPRPPPSIERAVDRTLLRGGEGSMAEARLASALAVIPQGVVVFDDDGAIAYRNEVAAGYLTARHGEALVEEAIAELAEEASPAGRRRGARPHRRPVRAAPPHPRAARPSASRTTAAGSVCSW